MNLRFFIISLTLSIFASTTSAQEAIPVSVSDGPASDSSQRAFQLERPSTTPFVVGAITSSVGVVAGTALLVKGLMGTSPTSCIDFCPTDDNTSIIGGAILGAGLLGLIVSSVFIAIQRKKIRRYDAVHAKQSRFKLNPNGFSLSF